MNKKIFLHGGSSLISKYLLEKYKNEVSEFYIFCRNIQKTKSILELDNFKNTKLIFFENNLENLEETINDLKKIPNDLDGVFWVTGYTGDGNKEITDIKAAELNLKVNFMNAILSITFLLKKIKVSKHSFICTITSVAGLRGRKKRLFYCASKSGLINFMSGLRQYLNGKIKVITVIPGYISTNSFTEKSVDFLITSPKKTSEIIYNSINKNKEIVYISNIWRVIMWFILIIPEKIFKKLNF